MRPIPVTPRETFDYVLKKNRQDPEGEQVVFKLSTPTVEQDAEYLNDVTVRGGVEARAVVKILRRHLKGWSGWPGIDFAADDKGVPTEETLKLVSPEDRGELAAAVINASYPDEEQVEK